METPIQIDFQGMAANASVRDSIIKHVSQLEDRFGRITAGRVVVKGPSGHHRKGGLYEINVRLALPKGREVIVDHTEQNDERYSDLNFSINDTFKRARRQLQDQVRKLGGQVKHHEGAPVGTVVELDPLGEFGFIETDDGAGDLLPPQQRARRRVSPSRCQFARHLLRRNGRERPAGEYRQADRKA